MAQRESIMDLINRLGVEKPDPRLRMDPYNYPSGAPDVVAQFGSGLQDMGQRLESTLQAEDELGRFAELIPRWLAANPAKRIGAVLQDPEGAIQQLRGMAEGAIEDPVGAAQSLGQAGIEAVQDPLGTAEQMSALEMLGGGKALSSIAKRLGRRDVGVTDEPKPKSTSELPDWRDTQDFFLREALANRFPSRPDVQPTRKGQLSQQLYEQAVARGEVPGEAALTQLRQSTDAAYADIDARTQTGDISRWAALDERANVGDADFVRRQFIDDLPDAEKARLDRAVKQGFNIDAFHGTAGDITDYDPGLLGKTTDAPSARKAFFFSADTETANSYAQYADAVELERVTKEELGAQLRPISDKLSQLGDRYSDRQIKALQDVDAQSGPLGASSVVRNKVWRNDPELQALKKDMVNAELQLMAQYQSVMPVKLRMTNPLVHDFKGESYREVSYHDLLQTAKDKGHDGVIMKNTTDGGPVTDIYAVFKPQQIRSQYATFEPERAPREVGDRPYAGEALTEKTLELQEDIKFASIDVDQLKSTALGWIERNEGPISAIYREVLDAQGNVKSGPIKFSGPVHIGAESQVQTFRKNITDAIEFKEKAEKELADLIKGKLRTPSKIAGPTYVLAEAAFPLGGITAAIAYDVNQRGDR